MFSRMSIWMTMSRLFSGLIKLREKCNRYFQFPVYLQLNDNYRKKVAPSFPGPLMPTRTDSWPSRSGDLGTKLSNCKIGSDFCAIWHLSFYHLCHTYYLLLKPPDFHKSLKSIFRDRPTLQAIKIPDIFSCFSWTKKVEGSRWRRRTGQRGWRQYTGVGIQGDKGAKEELLSRTLVQYPGSMMLMATGWLVRLRWSISPRWWEGS